MKHNIFTFLFAATLVVLGFVFWQSEFLYYILAAVIVAYVALTVYGVFNIEANYFLSSIHKGKGSSVTLTFDDGPDPEQTPRILAALKEQEVKATFFVIGKKAEQHPELIRQMVDEGHIVANHSYSHHYLIGFFSRKRLRADLERCNAVIEQITGKVPHYFRPPFGVTNPRYADVLQDMGMLSIGWSLRSLDTQAKNKYALIERILVKIKKKDIILLHDDRAVTADAIDDIVAHCEQKKIAIETLDWVTKTSPYVS
ncbi:peptidoglycan/xylan/chitin deacetylase (PgdA/CDA1 family) [Dyadobacter jejuensis]|uniref:Peptidoglycan/xylan/chitin deacetylase (PgdA/CDA1 family) n=1 Tax=Dyadobacter jejuensis TaxID=1082580 RepID=A0A316ALW6_9BACT|nr:polysaccharide deacetylase family protein [Dyadobacter jejuensis]PWJ58566.1 peptidoglycan/xylan/chitin deacetylase (PgdA/CDA1 family) [Dyadobacter jejuensis]